MQLSSTAAAALIVFVLIALVAFNGIATVESGTVGVVTRFGAVQQEVLQPGLHFKMPVMTDIIPLDTRIQKVVDEATASSKDLQVVTSKVALNYRIDSVKGGTIYAELGPQYPLTIVEPAIQESIKSITSQFTAEELITKRAEVKTAVSEHITQRLQRSNLLVTDFSIIDFNFSAEFNRAIEEKQVAEQAALRAKNDLERVKTEAEAAEQTAMGVAQGEIARAKAESEAQLLLRETLTPEILQLRAIERWDGKLPVYMGGETPVPFMALPRQAG